MIVVRMKDQRKAEPHRDPKVWGLLAWLDVQDFEKVKSGRYGDSWYNDVLVKHWMDYQEWLTSQKELG